MQQQKILKKRGKFIVLEGIDKCGKTTQQTLLRNKINNSVLIDFPNPITFTWELIKSYLNGNISLSPECSHLLFSLNRWELKSEIEKKLNSGNNIITSRYIHSGIAYSMAKGVDRKWCEVVDMIQGNSKTKLPKPDLIIFLDINPKTSSGREGFGLDINEKKSLQKKVRKAFMEILKGLDNVVIINCNGFSKSNIHKKIMSAVGKIVNIKE